MRLQPVEPAQLTPAQKPLYDDMKSVIENTFSAFKAIREDGALIGPWIPWLRFPQFGGPVWELAKAVAAKGNLPKDVRELAILVAGAKFHAGYQLYAHVLVAEKRGLDDETIATIVAGERPANLGPDLAAAYDVAAALVRGSVLAELVYKRGIDHFGQDGAAELIFLVAFYCMVSVTLNGFDVPVPE
jgi:4-carboxymuconolactone decarboxylase